mmetsp:Transcript_48260/g.71518  ORF Transcript_48260/g.71518 Transcript_48260/m.71518 type:complete len:157 (+) Transcript_48260:369-839(+)
MLVYPRTNRIFDLYPDSCDVQIGAMLIQDGKCLGCFSQKLNGAQLLYPMTDKELLSIAEGLKNFDRIIRGARIRVWSDHKNLMFGDTTVHQSQRVLRQKILISNDYNAEIYHIAGEENKGADGLSRLPTKATSLEEKEVFFQRKIYTFNDIFPHDG